MSAPYKTTPVFDEASLPAALRHEHRTKAGTWGLLRVLELVHRLLLGASLVAVAGAVGGSHGLF